MMPPFPKLRPELPYPWLEELKPEERGLYLIHQLLACAKHVAAGSIEEANLTLEQISIVASPRGDTMQRIASYFTEAFADRILKSWPGLYKAINSTKMCTPSDEIFARRLFCDLTPYMKVAFAVTNHAIVEAMDGEKMVHVIDLGSSEPEPWLELVKSLGTRPGGPPHLRITGIHWYKEVLDHMARVLTEEAEKLDIPFQFHPIVTRLEDLDVDKVRVRTGEALAITSVLQLHPLLVPIDPRALRGGGVVGLLPSFDCLSPDSASSPPLLPLTKLDAFLNAMRGLNPKLMFVAEQDSNHNGSSLMERVLEALHTYAALFDCLDLTVNMASVDRLKVEKMLYGEQIKNIIACEGLERKERHEKLDKWAHRLESAGFTSLPLSYMALVKADRMLKGCKCESYKIKEVNGCLLLCWQERPLFSVSGWRCKRYGY